MASIANENAKDHVKNQIKSEKIESDFGNQKTTEKNEDFVSEFETLLTINETEELFEDCYTEEQGQLRCKF